MYYFIMLANLKEHMARRTRPFAIVLLVKVTKTDEASATHV